jgi:tRNA (guanosine-2'-O-)-methyltransferase
MQGMVESLNVSVAGAIMLYEAWRQRSLRGMYDQPALDAQSLDQLFTLWMEK